MSAQRDCIHGHLARSCELCAAQNDHATACEQIDRLRAELAAERERAEKLQADADARLGDPRDIPADTGHREADRLICRLVSDDLDFQDCTDAVVLIRRLIADSKGPDEFATWKDAAVDERMKRVAAETERDTLRAENERLKAAGKDALHALESSRVFVTSRERCHKPAGEAWYDERVAKLRAALKGEP